MNSLSPGVRGAAALTLSLAWFALKTAGAAYAVLTHRHAPETT